MILYCTSWFMLIDAHAHIFPPAMRQNREALVLRDQGFRYIYRNEKAKMVGAEELIDMLDREQIDKAVVFGFPWQDSELCREGNDYVLESVVKFPDRLIGLITLPWSDSDAVLEECERGLAAGGKGVGELALYHRPFDNNTVKQIEPLAQMLEKKKLPFLLHMNEPVGHDYSGKTVIDFKALQNFIAAHPDLVIILAHWGGGFFFYELMPEIKKITTHVFYDTAASPFLYDERIYEVALSIVGEDRILFGSDYPLLSSRRYFKEMDLSIPSEEVQSKIKGENARRLFKL